MGDLVNLRRARKARERDGKSAEAEANRAAFGQTKAEKQASAATRAQADRRLDAHKRDVPGKGA